MMRKIIRKLLLVAGLSTVAALYLLAQTTTGLRLGLQIAEHLIPVTLHVEKIEGTLFSPLSLQHITYQDEDIDVSIESLALEWNPWQLWRSKFAITRLTLSDVLIKIKPSTSTDTSAFDLDSFDFLKWMALNYIKVNKITLINDDMRFVVDSIELSENNSDITFNLNTNQGNFSGKLARQWDAHWDFFIPDIAVFSSAAKGSVTFQGTIAGDRLAPTINANFNLQHLAFENGTINQVTGKLQLIAKPNTNSRLDVTATGLKIADYRLNKLNAVITTKTQLDKNNFTSFTTLALNQQRYLDLSFTTPKETNFNNFHTQPITAESSLTFSDIKTLAAFIPGIKNLQGKIQGHATLNGTLSQPTIAADLQLLNAEVTIPAAGVTLRNIQVRASTNNQAELNYSGSLQTEQGSAQWQGTTALLNADFATKIQLQGSNLTIVKLPEYKIIVSPDLKLQLNNGNAYIEGKLVIPEARINPEDFSDTVTLPDETVFAGQKSANTTSMLSNMPAMKIHIILGDNIFIHYQDLKTKLRGNINLSKTTSSPVTAVGEFHAYQGTYRAYNKILTIQKGRLLFTGGLATNPGLDIKATREIKIAADDPSSFEKTQALVIGVQILGTLDNPTLALFSEPSLPQPDILSYLILGIPQSQAGANQQTLLSAASAMGIGNNGSQQFEETRKKLQEGLGLSELNVESVTTFNPNASGGNGTDNTTSLVVGKKLAPNLYVHYTIGLFNPVSIVNLRYILSKRWSVQSETSTVDTGADLLYSIERE